VSALRFAIHDGIARLTLDRPEHGNSIDMGLARELGEAAQVCAADALVRCVVLTGAGRLFCAGGDIRAFVDEGTPGPTLRKLADAVHTAQRTLATMEKPLVVLVNGPAAGAGVGVAAIGDIVLAAESAHFTAAYTTIGLTPDGGLTWLLPRLVGLRAAQEMILTNRRINAAEAAAIGLVTRVVADKELEAEGRAIAERMVSGATQAFGVCRRLILEGMERPFFEHLDAEAAAISAAGERREGREGVAAFLARRKPEFDGAKDDG